jgi:hypothetical protein
MGLLYLYLYMMHGVEVWGLGDGKENDKIQGSFVFMRELRIPRHAASKIMNAEKQR